MGIIMDVGKGRGEIIISPLSLFYFLPTDWGEQRFECAPSALMNLSKKIPEKASFVSCVLCQGSCVPPAMVTLDSWVGGGEVGKEWGQKGEH